MLKVSGARQKWDGTSKVYSHYISHEKAWYTVEANAQTNHVSRMLDRLISANSANWGTTMEVVGDACVLCLSGAGGSWITWDMLLVISNVAVWMALSWQAHCLQVVLGLRFSISQPLPLMCHPQPALIWNRWEASNSYVGSGSCCLLHLL